MARRGTDNVTLRLDPNLWQRFGELTDDRSAVLRDFVRWYVREAGVKMPRRPDIDRKVDTDQAGD
jgi:hypothetical protein